MILVDELFQPFSVSKLLSARAPIRRINVAYRASLQDWVLQL